MLSVNLEVLLPVGVLQGRIVLLQELVVNQPERQAGLSDAAAAHDDDAQELLAGWG